MVKKKTNKNLAEVSFFCSLFCSVYSYIYGYYTFYTAITAHHDFRFQSVFVPFDACGCSNCHFRAVCSPNVCAIFAKPFFLFISCYLERHHQLFVQMIDLKMVLLNGTRSRFPISFFFANSYFFHIWAKRANQKFQFSKNPRCKNTQKNETFGLILCMI